MPFFTVPLLPHFYFLPVLILLPFPLLPPTRDAVDNVAAAGGGGCDAAADVILFAIVVGDVVVRIFEFCYCFLSHCFQLT